MKLNDLSRQTVVLNNENSDLQNKLDSLKSFNNVDKTLQQNNMLQRAGQVIETDEVTVDSEFAPTKSSSKKVFNYALGF
jgi:DNA integrity scanning protein DisA with diadenylate cyclase activity